MAILTDSNGNVFLEFIEVEQDQIAHVQLDAPLTHAIIAMGKYLFMYNKWRNSWQLPGGVIEEGESPRQCVIRRTVRGNESESRQS